MVYSLSNPPPNIEEARVYLLECSVEKENGCRLWTRGLFKRGGYGSAHWPRYSRAFNEKGNPTPLRAHRMAWVVFKGPITEDQHVLHVCDTQHCIEETHLFLGDQQSNMADKVAKDRQNKGESHGRAKLTKEQVIAIRSDTRPQKEIAADYQISVATVSDIKRLYSWRHLP